MGLSIPFEKFFSMPEAEVQKLVQLLREEYSIEVSAEKVLEYQNSKRKLSRQERRKQEREKRKTEKKNVKRRG